MHIQSTKNYCTTLKCMYKYVSNKYSLFIIEHYRRIEANYNDGTKFLAAYIMFILVSVSHSNAAAGR